MGIASAIALAPLVLLRLAAATLPAGTEIEIRLTSEVTSEKPAGAPARAVVDAPVYLNGAVVLGAGAVLEGATTEAAPARAASDPQGEQAARLLVEWSRIREPGGRGRPLRCVLESVDNAREKVGADGAVEGIKASETWSARMDRGIGKLEDQYAELAQVLASAKGAFVKEPDPSIDYKAGVEMTLRLTEPLRWDARAGSGSPRPIGHPETLRELVDQEPYRTMARKPPKPSDVTNLLFLGTAEQVTAAFEQAGWTASQRGRSSKMETARAMIEDRGYSEAPMSLLLLDGLPPDLTFEKANNTFAKRHHIRIWRRQESFDGKPAWVAAATHDISIAFSRTSKSFTHGIDSRIDLERSKVYDDLVFTGKVCAAALVERDGLSGDLSNATGDELITDGKVAVLEF